MRFLYVIHIFIYIYIIIIHDVLIQSVFLINKVIIHNYPDDFEQKNFIDE